MNITASNAVLVKARAMYGQRLTGRNYIELTACRSVGEIASYLRSNTSYSDILENISPGNVHRRQLESLVYEKLFVRLAALCRYENAAGGGFTDFLVLRTDSEQLIHAVRNLNSDHPGEFIVRIPEYFSKYSHLNATLYSISDFDALMSAVSGTEYESWLKPFSVRGLPDVTDYFDMELAINRRINEKTRKIFKKNLIGADRTQVLEMLRFRSDIENLISVYRLKSLGYTSQQALRASIYTDESLLTSQLWNSIISSNDCDAMLAILKSTRYRTLSDPESAYLEQAGQKMMYSEYKKLLRFSTQPCTVMLSFVYLAENEVKNLNHIIEGVRYNMTPTEISNLLIGAGD